MLHIERLQQTIGQLSRRVAEQRQARAAHGEELLTWLEVAPGAGELRALLERERDAAERCAVPVTDAALQRRFTPHQQIDAETTVVAVDGSQIMPDRHAPILYYLIQVGGLIFRYDGQAPTTHTQAELHFEESEIYDREGLLVRGRVGMRRTIAELAFLAQLSEGATATLLPKIALVDGPLLWPYSERCSEPGALSEYLGAFGRLREAQALPLGFVERPGGRPLVELLGLWHRERENAGREQSGDVTHRPLDRDLMARFLGPGERSVWFERRSAMNQRHMKAGHTIWFCYVNVGAPHHPVIARLEAPRWAVHPAGGSERAHTVLWQQAQVLDGHPYVLARAHELALVTQKDKTALDHLLQRRVLEQEALLTEPSAKARQKSYLGKR